MAAAEGDARAPSKLEFDGARVLLPVAEAEALASGILRASGFADAVAREVAGHLADADLSGVESHGTMRVLQYAEQAANGYLRAGAAARLVPAAERGWPWVDGGGGIGIPAMRIAVDDATDRALRDGIAVATVRNVGHTGRIGAFADRAAARGALAIIVGGGGRKAWRQAAPHGGRKALLPTNPYSIGIPGGARGPVVIDFATSMIAGGWLHSARAAGALVPAGSIIDSDGRPTRDPAAYFAGGAILPKGGPMGYGMAVMAELICEAMLGPATTECNWLVLALDTSRFGAPARMREMAEEMLAELRDCPPAPGFARVEVPGERERALREANLPRGIALPERTLASIRALAARLGAR
jgi:LDH2 family malate/lactate/ureidoglycolate dehydrogenase